MSRKLLNVSRIILNDAKIARNLSATSEARESGDENFKEERRKFWTIGTGVGLGLGLGLGIGLAVQNNHKLEAAVPFNDDSDSGSSPRKRFNFIADVVAKCGPSVVYIEIKDANTDMFFGGHSATSNGSGFIVQEDGLILTNAHVVVNKPRSSVSVKLQDGRVFLAKVEKVDMHSDLATLRIPVKNLPVMKLGTSADIRPGEWVVALGSPLTLSNTVTAGVVSSTTRNSDELGLHGKDMTYIQTDAAITFGNSGGPLVNLDGEAIGINSMKVASGISFAIPIDYAKRFLNSSSKSDPTHVKKFLGITMLSLTPTIIRAIHQKTSQISQNITFGVLVYRIVQGSPAHNSGLFLGDIITHFNGKEIHSATDVYNILEKSTGPVTIRVHRDNRNFDIVVNPLEYADYA